VRYQQDLQVALRDRYRRLVVAGYATLGQEIQLVASWIGDQPALRGILEEAERVEPGLDFDTWEKSLMVSQIFSWGSQTEAGRATLAWILLRQIAANPADTARNAVLNYASRITRTSGVDDIAQAFAQMVLSPLFDFLIEQVGAQGSVLYLLERYVRRVEWFERDDLYQRYQADRQNGEAVYDRDLRKFLFSEGINMPFSQVRAASGLSDVLTDLDTDDPFIGEVKLFDAGNHGKRELATGVNQATQYAQDWGKNTGYLVIINLSGRPLELPTDGPEGAWLPSLDHGGVRVYLIAVRALPMPTASQQGKPRPVTVTREDLINPDV
jgi:hypothetical protein